MTKWNVLQRNEAALGRFKVIQEHVKLSSSEEFHFSYLDFSNGVCIIPELADGQYVAIQQYRHATGNTQWEFPAGMMEKGLTPLEVAKKELLEETGYEANQWIELGSFYPSAGSTSEKIYLFAARELIKKETNLEITEDIQTTIISENELFKLIMDNEFQHGGGLAAYLKYSLIKKQQG